MDVSGGGLVGARLVRWLVAVCAVLVAGGLAGSARAAVSYSQQTLPFTGLAESQGVAVDPAGDVFASSFTFPSSGDPVLELSPGGVQTEPDSGSFLPALMATDASGDLYVADYSGAGVVKIPAGGGSPTTIVVPGAEDTEGVAVDNAGDLFVTDIETGDVYELQQQQGGSWQTTTVLSGLPAPTGVAVDSAGDLFVAELPGTVQELPAGDPASDLKTIASGLPNPFGVAVDHAGNVYVAELDGNQVVELSPQAGGSYASAPLPFTGVADSEGVAVDQYGDVFAAGQGGPPTNAEQVFELAVNESQSISWASHASYAYSGSTVTESLNASASSGLTVSYAVSSGNSVCSVTGSTLTITGTGTCVLTADQAGGFNWTRAFSKANEAQQTVTIGEPQSISWGQQGPYLVGASPVTLDATATPSRLPVSYEVQSGPCSVSGSKLTLTGAGVCVVSASQAGNSQYLPATSVQQSIVVEYGFEGFITPPWKDTFQPGATIPVWFVLTDQKGKPITAAAAAALGKAGAVQAVLNGPGITQQTTACRWYSIVFECSVKTPKTVKTGTSYPYMITAQENVGAGFLIAPPIGPAQNPVMIYFK